MRRRRGLAAAIAVLCVGVGGGAAHAAGPVFFTKAAIGATAPGAAFAGTSGASFVEAASGTKFTCAGGTISGEVTGATTMRHVTVILTGCEAGGVGYENIGPREIELEPLEGTLGNVASGTPGIRLFNEAEGRGGTIARFTSFGGASKNEIKGSVVGALGGASGTSVEAGKLATSIKLTFAESKGIQKYSRFLPGEGEPGEEQEMWNSGVGFESDGFSSISTLKTTPLGQFGVTK
jgi:hypothetical protein